MEVRDLVVTYRRGLSSYADTIAVRGVSFQVRMGETVGLIGESGSGKSTVLGAICGLIPATSGQIAFNGETLRGCKRSPAFRRSVAMLFQSAAVDPRMRVADIVAEPIENERIRDKREIRARVAALLELVGLDGAMIDSLPTMLSGGQLQRVAIARALALRPKLLLADEPVSALDVTVRAQILNVLRELCAQLSIACVFVTHDLGVARRMCDQLCIMRDGLIVERGGVNELFDHPKALYTKQLMASVLPINPAMREASARYRADLIRAEEV